MTSYDSSGNIKTAIEAISTYTISATGTITDAVFWLFLATADTQVTADDPGFTQAQANEAVALYMCHQIARKKGQTGKTSLSIGKYSYSKKLESGLTSWLDEYRALIKRVSNVSYPISSLDTDGITRDDSTMSSLKLDAAPVVSASDARVTDYRGTIADLLGG